MSRPLQNRVTPMGEIVATPARGTLMGNRGGRIHRDDQTLGAARWRSKQWIACVLEFKTRHRAVMGRGYTELFFLDEATALAAGHRPCFECRRADANRFAAAWAKAKGLTRPPRAPEMDAVLHGERLGEREVAVASGLPDGSMILWQGQPHLVWQGMVREWSHKGYGPARAVPDVPTPVLTPGSVRAALAGGYTPAFHASIAH